MCLMSCNQKFHTCIRVQTQVRVEAFAGFYSRVACLGGGGGGMQHAKDEDGAAPAKTYGPQWMYH